MVKEGLNFDFTRIPCIHFGTGKIKELSSLVSTVRGNILLVSSRSFTNSEDYGVLIKDLENIKNKINTIVVSGEPSPEVIDNAVIEYKNKEISTVVGIGGGSVIDSGKAISAMLLLDGSVADYLEGVGTKKHSGIKVPYIAVPTTSGTGSEATKNAVISDIGENGFKKSLRHNNFVPDHAIVDPALTISCPRESTAACGLDALTQLLESYTSNNSSDMTDALALSGLQKIKDGFEDSFNDGSNIAARECMSYAALMSGITLANAGLGVVHGFASPIGGFFNIPHGVVCGTILGISLRVNIDTMFDNTKENMQAIEKYSKAGEILSGEKAKSYENGCQMLIDTVEGWIKYTGIKTLGYYGITLGDLDKIIDKTSCKYNPAKLEYKHLRKILESRL